MILGVHASITAGCAPGEVRATLDREGWPWLGRPGRFGTRELRLEGRPPQCFHLRVASSRGVGRHGAMWHVRLERPDGPLTADPLVDLQLMIEPLRGGGTRLSFDGRAARSLWESTPVTSRSLIRAGASAYARSLLEQIVTVLELRPVAAQTRPQPKPDAGATVGLWPPVRASRAKGA
jgi:hypothetical protein